jgi:hypothetical protein
VSKSKLNLVFAAAICFVACSSLSHHPESKLLGKWQASDEKPSTKKVSHQLYWQDQYEFFADGSVARAQKHRSKDGTWEQAGTGTFKVVDPTHIKIDLGWYYGTAIYEITWLDKDHISLRVGDDVTQLVRIK